MVPSNNNQTRYAPTPSPTPSPISVASLEGTVWEGTSRGYVRIFEFKTGGKVIQRVGGKAGEKAPVYTVIGSWKLQGNSVYMNFPEKMFVAEEIEATIQGDEMSGNIKWKDRPNLHDTILVRKTR
jgi:hypothetical protein